MKKLATGSGKATVLVMGEPESREEWRWKAAMDARDELVAAGAIYPDMERAVQTLGRYVAYMAERRAMH